MSLQRTAMNWGCHIDLFWSEVDGAWIADVPDLKSCSAFEALAEVQRAMEA